MLRRSPGREADYGVEGGAIMENDGGTASIGPPLVANPPFSSNITPVYYGHTL
jgi:hypothetical protein